MLVSQETATKEYESLNPADQDAVQQILLDSRRRLLMSGIKVDMPYFFYSIHKPMFAKGEEVEFLEITDPKVFAINAIFHISRFIKKSRGGTTNE